MSVGRERVVARPEVRPHGRAVAGGEPLVFHCNFYNYWLQKTVLLPKQLAMGEVIASAAESSTHAMLTEACRVAGAVSPQARRAIAEDQFALLGFGTLDLGLVGVDGGVAHTPTSHYGQTFVPVVGSVFSEPQNGFDQGYAAGAAAVIHGLPPGAFRIGVVTCRSTGAPRGTIELLPGGKAPYAAVGVGKHAGDVVVPPPAQSGIDEGAVLAALATLDLDGNEEGLIPRFGVFLTRHLANFYNRVSFEFFHRMAATGLQEDAAELLVDAGFRCAFNTFGGIMTSPEWDAVVRPMVKTEDDWVHGMVACVNALGWGVWRVVDLSADRIVVRIYDDYESAGYHDMYGPAAQPVCWLHMGGVAGLMNLVRIGRIQDGPKLTPEFYVRCFEDPTAFVPRVLKSFAGSDPYTEIEAVRR